MGSVHARGQRDLRIDFFRGLALIFIFIDHIPDNKLANFTLKNFGFADAAELFVVLAGFSAVLAYGKTFETQGWKAGSTRVLRRARDIYVWHLALVLVCGFGLSALAFAYANPTYVEALKLHLFAEQPGRAVALAATLTNQPNLLNILPLYIVLLALWTPIMLWLVLHRPRLALATSFAIWALANLASLNLPSHQHPEGWVFNPFAWQLLMTVGAVAARATLRGEVVLVPALIALAAAYVAFAFVFAAPWTLVPGFETWRIIPADALGPIDRIYVSPWRLVHIAALCYLVLVLVPMQSPWLKQPWAAAVACCGRYSLQIFCLATVLSLAGWVFLQEHGGNGLAAQMLVNVVGIALLLGTAWMLSQRQKTEQRVVLAPA